MSSTLVETENDELNPFTSLLSQNTTVDHPISTVDHHHLNSINADILIRQLPSQGLSFQLWPAATTLFSLLDNHHPFLSYIPNHRIRILELGSGTGLVGIAAAAILGADVTVTDLAHVIPNLKFNAEANSELIASSGGSVEAAELSWGNVKQMETIGRDYDLILGSDVVYHDHLYEPLIDTLKYLLLPTGERKEGEEIMFVMAHLKRWKKEASFFRKARKLFDVQVIHRECPSDGKRVGVNVYTFVSKSSGLGLGSGSDCSTIDPNLSVAPDMENDV